MLITSHGTPLPLSCTSAVLSPAGDSTRHRGWVCDLKGAGQHGEQIRCSCRTVVPLLAPVRDWRRWYRVVPIVVRNEVNRWGFELLAGPTLRL